MKDTFELYATWKKADIILQCLLFCVMIGSLFFIFLFGLYIMAIGQCISAVIWLTASNVPQKHNSRKFRRFIVGVCLLLLLTLIVAPGIFLLVSILMLLAGPVIGFCYFAMTISEFRYFANARKPYYLR